MNVKIYNKILNTERSHTLTERFAASKRISDIYKRQRARYIENVLEKTLDNRVSRRYSVF